jgi:hypothetical protein
VAAKTVSLVDKDGNTQAKYSWANLNAESREQAVGLGFITKLGATSDPAAFYDHVVAYGSFPEPAKRGRQAGAGATSDAVHWKEAIAYALGDMLAKQNGVKPRPGQALHQSPEYEPFLQAARTSVGKWDKAKIKKASGRTEVAAHFQRITGLPSLLEMFEDEAEEDQAEAA